MLVCAINRQANLVLTFCDTGLPKGNSLYIVGSVSLSAPDAWSKLFCASSGINVEHATHQPASERHANVRGAPGRDLKEKELKKTQVISNTHLDRVPHNVHSFRYKRACRLPLSSKLNKRDNEKVTKKDNGREGKKNGERGRKSRGKKKPNKKGDSQRKREETERVGKGKTQRWDKQKKAVATTGTIKAIKDKGKSENCKLVLTLWPFYEDKRKNLHYLPKPATNLTDAVIIFLLVHIWLKVIFMCI